MNRIERQLREFTDELSQRDDVTTMDVVNIMRLIRMMIERDGSNGQHKTLCLFCHLGSHASLTRANNLVIVERLNRALIEFKDDYGVASAVNRAFKLNELRSELIGLLKAKGFDAPILHYRAGWIHFLSRLFTDIAGREVRLPSDIEQLKSSKAERKIFDRMVDEARLAYGQPWIPVSFKFDFEDVGDVGSIIPRLRWIIEMSTVPLRQPDQLIGPVGIMEDRQAFELDGAPGANRT